MNNVLEVQEVIYKSLLKTKDYVIEIMETQNKIIKIINKIEEKIKKLENKNG